MAKTENVLLQELVPTLYFRDTDGNYLGGFNEGNPAIPEGAIEVANAPEHFLDKWVITNGVGAWVKPNNVKRDELIAALSALEHRETSLRAIRETLILVITYFGSLQNKTPTALYEENPAFKGFKDLDKAASDMRKEIGLLK